MDTIAIPSNTPPITVEGCPELEAAVSDVYAPAATETSPAGYSPDLPLFVICVRGSSKYLNKTFRAAQDAMNHLLSIAALLESLDYDLAGLNSGYGLALDHVIDGVINAFAHLNAELAAILDH